MISIGGKGGPKTMASGVGPSSSALSEIEEFYSRLQKVGIGIRDDLGWFAFFLWFGVGGYSYSNLLASAVYGDGSGRWVRFRTLEQNLRASYC